jgi:RHS repeat-associated protein
MKIKKLEFLAFIMIVLIVSMPICFSAQMNLVYDANGNLITGDGVYRVYNSMNRLVKIYNGTNTSGVLLEENIHDTDGEKIILRKIYNSTGAVIERRFYPSENSIYVKNLTAQVNITRVYHNGQLIAENTNGLINYIHTDNKGNVVAVTNSTGKMIENTSYGPYGDITSGGTKSKLSYEAKEYSSVLKSYDFNFRRYNPNSQLFEQPDTIIQNAYNPQSLNHYSFELNNPMKNIDPNGHESYAPGFHTLQGSSGGYIESNMVSNYLESLQDFGKMLYSGQIYEETKQNERYMGLCNNLGLDAYSDTDLLTITNANGESRISTFKYNVKYANELYKLYNSDDSYINNYIKQELSSYIPKNKKDHPIVKTDVINGNKVFVIVPKENTYYINGKEVTEQEYNKKLNAAKERESSSK